MNDSASSTGTRSSSFRDLALKTSRVRRWPLLALDPGGTTGWALFRDHALETAGQVVGTPDAVDQLLRRYQPTTVVMEEYRIYADKLHQHTHSDVPTIQLIGAIKYICSIYRIPVVTQSASSAKFFVTDEKLRTWGMWQVGQQHARDAVRHGARYVLLGGG